MSAKSGIDKKCPQCGALFYVQAHRAAEAKFCSMKCLWSGRKKRPRKMVECVCEHCKSAYVVAAYRAAETRFCSKRCLMQAKIPEIEGPRLASMKRRPKMSDEERRRRKKACHAIYLEKNKEILKKKAAEKYEANKELFSSRARRWREKNQDKVRKNNQAKRLRDGEHLREKRRQHYRENKPRYVAQARAREEIIKRATPSWADMEAIIAIYAEAERMTVETGIKHHVDHFYPLQGKTMCGLHVEGNLRIIPMIDNLRKGNSEPAAEAVAI